MEGAAADLRRIRVGRSQLRRRRATAVRPKVKDYTLRGQITVHAPPLHHPRSTLADARGGNGNWLVAGPCAAEFGIPKKHTLARHYRAIGSGTLECARLGSGSIEWSYRGLHSASRAGVFSLSLVEDRLATGHSLDRRFVQVAWASASSRLLAFR